MQMQKPTYVYPNVSKRRTQTEPPRGGLLERWDSAKECSCKYIEAPGNFLKKNEVIPPLYVGDILSKEAIRELYQKDKGLPSELRYILHTDPELEPHHKLDWDKAAWRKQFTEMINNISQYFEVEPSIIEIHPSVGIKNPFGCIVEGITAVLDSFQQTSKSKPMVLLENRTYKQISNGREIRDYWRFLVDNNKELTALTGIVLDFKTLFTQTRADLKKKTGRVSPEVVIENFKQDLKIIPSEALKAYHIHGYGDKPHQIPKENDEIPWKNVFEKIKENNGNIIINPEVLNHSSVEPTIKFCKTILGNIIA
jgi:hypothetical protein